MTTINNTFGQVYDNSGDQYEIFEDNLKSFFNAAIKGVKKLFKTNVDGLFETFLANLPAEARQHYTCNECRRFIDRFGGLVEIDENGVKHSVMWNEDVTPKFFKASVRAMKKAVLQSKVVEVFIPQKTQDRPNELLLGQPKTGEWTHLSVTLPESMRHTGSLTPYQQMAEYKTDFSVLINSLQDFDLNVATKAVQLLESETFNRADRVLPNAKFFKDIATVYHNALNAEEKRNLVWLAVVNAPTGLARVRSSMIGTLLEDLASGMSIQFVKSRFEEKMGGYMVSEAPPSATAIVEAEKTIAEKGLTNSLGRKYATLEEIPEEGKLWKPVVQKIKASSTYGKAAEGSVFGHLAEKAKAPVKKATINDIELPTKVMTWEKFQRTVLPTAQSMEVLNNNSNRLMALVTALDADAPTIFHWDNPFSWYYHGGIDGEIKKRVEEAGGRYENNLMRVSLIWEGRTDLDLHCINPVGQHIYYSTGSRRDRFGGYLDLDMNGMDKSSDTPVENMRWAVRVPEGRFKFYVHNYQERVNRSKGTPFRVELEVHGQVYTYEGQPLTDEQAVTVFEFDYKQGQQPEFISNGHALSANSSWNVQANEFIPVTAVTTSPNMWGENPMKHIGQHVFFLLDGVKDVSEGKGRGFYNEILKGELHSIRKVLELFTANTPIVGAEEATACGVGFSKDKEWNLTLRVKADGATQLIKIDRWD